MSGLGGTRQPDDRRGILRPDEGMAHFRLTRLRPSPDVAGVVDTHWVVRWDLRGRASFEQQILPHPCVNLVWEPEGPAVYGIVQGRFVRRIAERGEAVGVKFRPGAFSAFSAVPAVQLTGCVVPFSAALGPDGAELARAGEAAGSAAERIALAEAFLRARAGDGDPRVQTVVAVAESMRAGPPEQRVSDVAAQHGLSVRTLQRLFREHVGVSPKWVLQRYRMHDAAERIAAGEAPEPAELALELGYFDQAHFSNDFRRYVGVPPAQYAAMCAAAAGAIAA